MKKKFRLVHKVVCPNCENVTKLRVSKSTWNYWQRKGLEIVIEHGRCPKCGIDWMLRWDVWKLKLIGVEALK